MSRPRPRYLSRNMCGGGVTLCYQRSARVSLMSKPSIYAADTQAAYEPHVYPFEIAEKKSRRTARHRLIGT